MFQFKQFSIRQEQSAMKVGTDSILLGAWAEFENDSRRILDIGAGTGILSLMLAQRFSKAKIDAVEIEQNAFDECTWNFEHSNWRNRLSVFHYSIQEFIEMNNSSLRRYDAIISNPPFFNETILPTSKGRLMARNTLSLSFEDLVTSVSKLVKEDGLFATIIPYSSELQFRNICESKGLHLKKCCRVKGTPNTEIKRSLLLFTFEKRSPEITEISIENSRHNYTKAFIEITKDFYLNF